ncbi:MAG: hypothetical protein ACLUNO_06085 [Oscillospiraceae bacterium]
MSNTSASRAAVVFAAVVLQLSVALYVIDSLPDDTDATGPAVFTPPTSRGFSRAVTRLVNAVKAFGQFARAVLQLFGVDRGFRQRAAEAVERKAVDLPRRRSQIAGSSHFVAERGQIVTVPLYVCVKIRVHRGSPADHALA